MAHELENMFSVKQTPWHNLGKVVTEAPDIAAVLEMAGLNWTVSQRAMQTLEGLAIPKFQAIVRDSDNTVLGVAGKRFRPLQNADALEFFRPFHDSGAAKFETAGSLRNGQKVWIMAALQSPEMEIVKGDMVRKYLLLSNGHDGNTGIRVGFTPVRVVCANTLAMAHNNGASKLVRVFHSKQTLSNLELLRDAVNAANASFEATAEQYRALAKRQVNQADIAKYVDVVFYNGATAESDRAKLARENLTLEITKLFEAGHGNDMAGVRGTAWALYNGVTQYLSYDAGRSDDIRMDSLWFGDNGALNSKALDAALELVVA